MKKARTKTELTIQNAARRVGIRSVDELAREAGIKGSTFADYMKYPQNMRLSHLRALNEVVGFTDEEWLSLRRA